MDLWVRSQKGNLIGKVEQLKLDKANGEYMIIVNGKEFATYYSESRALEVLDEVYERLSGEYMVNNSNVTTMNSVWPIIAYQFPKNNE